MPLIGFRGCRKSELMPRNDSEIAKSNADPMPTSTASTAPRLPDGSGRNPCELVGRRGQGTKQEPDHAKLDSSKVYLLVKGFSDERRDSNLPLAAKHSVDHHQHDSHSLD